MASQAANGYVDRQKTTPFLLRLFYRKDSFHRESDFSANARLPPHLQIYTWQSCTLRELTTLLLATLPDLIPEQPIGTRIAFRLFYADTRSGSGGRYTSKELGSVVVANPARDPAPAANVHPDRLPIVPTTEDTMDIDQGNPEPVQPVSFSGVKDFAKYLAGEPEKTLEDGKFVIGDYVSCAVFAPLPDGSVAPAPAPARGSELRGPGAFGGGGRGGYGGDRRGENGFGFGGGRGRGGGGRDGPRVPPGDWRRGDVPPGGGGGGFWRGGGGGRGRARGGW